MAFNASTAEEFLLNSDGAIACICLHSKQLQNLSIYSDLESSIKTSVLGSLNLPSKVQFYGSRVIGVASTESDLDIFLNIDNTTYQMYLQNDEHDDRFKKVAAEMQKSEKWQLKELITNTPVPVIVATYRPMEIKCIFLYLKLVKLQIFHRRWHQHNERIWTRKLKSNGTSSRNPTRSSFAASFCSSMVDQSGVQPLPRIYADFVSYFLPSKQELDADGWSR